MKISFSFLFQFQLDAFKEEGLFRIASSTLKIKRLAALFDTGETSDLVIKEITDPHVFSGMYSFDYKGLNGPLFMETTLLSVKAKN